MNERGTSLGKVLIIGYGNPGRLDDGLGPAFADAMEGRRPPGVTVESDYQLHVEHAQAAAEHDVVLFVDADRTGPAPYSFRRIEPDRARLAFSTHCVSPGAVIGLARELFGGHGEGFLLGIRGYAFDGFGEQLTARARAHLDRAIEFIERLLRTGDLDEAVGRRRAPTAAETAGQRCQT